MFGFKEFLTFTMKSHHIELYVWEKKIKTETKCCFFNDLSEIKNILSPWQGITFSVTFVVHNNVLKYKCVCFAVFKYLLRYVQNKNR